MPAPIMPAPSTATLRTSRFGTSFGRPAPELTAFRSKKSAWIMFLLVCPQTSSVKYRASIAIAVSTSTCELSTAAARMLRGAGYGAPASCLRRLDGKAGRLAAKAGCAGVPPGILWPLTSQGCCAVALASMKARALVSISSWSVASSCTRPISSACAGRYWRPCSSTFRSASAMPSSRTVRTTPPPPGSSPRVTSGRPILLPGASSATRWWQARASSRPPPRALPFIAATTGLPSVSSRRRARFSAIDASKNSAARSGPTVESSRRSPPAKKVFFAEVMITPRRPSSAARRSTTPSNATRKASFIVLTDCAGSSRTSVTTPSCPCSQRMAGAPSGVRADSDVGDGDMGVLQRPIGKPEGDQARRSTMVAMPMPPPTQRVARP